MYEYAVSKVLRVVDGDTVDLEIDLGLQTFVRTRVRLYGINAPEVRGEERERGLLATDWLKAELHGVPLKIRTHKDKQGKFGRWLGMLWAAKYESEDGTEWVNINEAMVQAGHAKVAHY